MKAYNKKKHRKNVNISLVFTCNDLRLSVDDFFGGSCLSLLQLLTNAGDHTQIVLQSMSHLKRRQSQSLPANKLPSLCVCCANSYKEMCL